MIRAKFMVSDITNHVWGGATVKLKQQYDETIPEDQRFYEATPTGSFEMLVNNPRALEELKLGEFFYIDLMRIPQGEPKAG